MAFCTYCGTQLQEGVQHVCAASEAAAAAKQQNSYANQEPPQQQFQQPQYQQPQYQQPQQYQQQPQFQQQYQQQHQQQYYRPAATVDGAVFMQMFQNPLQAATYGADKVLNGVIGLVASVIAYFLLGLVRIRSTGFGVDFLDNFIGRSSFGFAGVLKTYFLGGIITLAVFVAAFALFGLVFGNKKIGFSEIVAKFGSIQILTAAGYLVTAIMSLAGLGSIFNTATIWITLLVTAIVAIEAFDIAPSKRFAYMASAVGSYVAVDWLFGQIF